jgi:hypothetical protein
MPPENDEVGCTKPSCSENRRDDPSLKTDRDFVENRAVVGAKRTQPFWEEACLPVGYMLCV